MLKPAIHVKDLNKLPTLPLADGFVAFSPSSGRLFLLHAGPHQTHIIRH